MRPQARVAQAGGGQSGGRAGIPLIDRGQAQTGQPHHMSRLQQLTAHHEAGPGPVHAEVLDPNLWRAGLEGRCEGTALTIGVCGGGGEEGTGRHRSGP